MTEWSVAVVIPGSQFHALKSVLLDLSPPFVIFNDLDFAWRSAGMDITLRFSDDEYLGTGWMSCSQGDAVSRCLVLSRALEGRGLKYKLELFTNEIDGPVFEWGED